MASCITVCCHDWIWWILVKYKGIHFSLSSNYKYKMAAQVRHSNHQHVDIVSSSQKRHMIDIWPEKHKIKLCRLYVNLWLGVFSCVNFVLTYNWKGLR
jgi:hypothetical protein